MAGETGQNDSVAGRLKNSDYSTFPYFGEQVLFFSCTV